MAVNPDYVQVWHCSSFQVNFFGAADFNAELIFFQAGGNVGVGLRIHVRVDAQGNRRDFAHVTCYRVDAVKLGFGFDVETADTDFQRLTDFCGFFANAGKYHLAGVAACT